MIRISFASASQSGKSALFNLCLPIILFGGTCLSQNASAQAPTPRPVFDSKEIHIDNTVTLRYYAPNAKEVRVSTQMVSYN